jgi:hypothetical protein
MCGSTERLCVSEVCRVSWPGRGKSAQECFKFRGKPLGRSMLLLFFLPCNWMSCVEGR